MFRRIAPCALLGILFFSACKQEPKFKKLASGLKYRIIKDEKKGDTARIGDMMKFHLYIHAGDSSLMNTREMNRNQPIEIPRMPANFPGDWLEGLGLLTAGDSAVFLVPVDTLRKISGPANQLPPWMKDGTDISYKVKVVSITPATPEQRKQIEQMQQAQQAQQNAQSQQPQAQPSNQDSVDDALLKKYFKAKGISPKSTPSGLYYSIEKEGTGPQLTAGQMVSMRYRGTLLNGVEFDKSREAPFTFQLGTGNVIAGWDEGVALLKKGAKAHFYLPSRIAYGPNSPSAEIPANSPMVFDVEVVDAK
jgi:FKBP-type peptidyl-prolyl cis-trans isomerase